MRTQSIFKKSLFCSFLALLLIPTITITQSAKAASQPAPLAAPVLGDLSDLILAEHEEADLDSLSNLSAITDNSDPSLTVYFIKHLKLSPNAKLRIDQPARLYVQKLTLMQGSEIITNNPRIQILVSGPAVSENARVQANHTFQNQGRDGNPGAQGNAGTNGEPAYDQLSGARGVDGSAGADGSAGSNGSDVEISLRELSGKLYVDVSGGNGGNGGNGGVGGRGGNGLSGRQAMLLWKFKDDVNSNLITYFKEIAEILTSPNLAVAGYVLHILNGMTIGNGFNGGNAGWGGNGANAGNGGNGGNAGNVTLNLGKVIDVVPNPSSDAATNGQQRVLVLQQAGVGGAGGVAGVGGPAGIPGKGGQAGDIFGKAGKDGKPGFPGLGGQVGKAGKVGLAGKLTLKVLGVKRFDCRADMAVEMEFAESSEDRRLALDHYRECVK